MGIRNDAATISTEWRSGQHFNPTSS
jgi:hypothetical protein